MFGKGVSPHHDFHAYPSWNAPLPKRFLESNLGWESRTVKRQHECRRRYESSREEFNSRYDARRHVSWSQVQPADNLVQQLFSFTASTGTHKKKAQKKIKNNNNNKRTNHVYGSRELGNGVADDIDDPSMRAGAEYH